MLVDLIKYCKAVAEMRSLSRWVFVTCISVLAVVSSAAQEHYPLKKIHAWFQPVTPGIISKNEERQPKKKGNYFLFVESDQVFQLQSLWIYGKPYDAKLKQLQGPVYLSTSGDQQLSSPAEKTLLAPKTDKKLFQLLVTTADSTHKQNVLPEKFQSKAVVIKLKYGKKTVYCTGDTIKELNPLGMY